MTVLHLPPIAHLTDVRPRPPTWLAGARPFRSEGSPPSSTSSTTAVRPDSEQDVRRLLAAVTETERLGEAEPRLPAHRLLRRAKSVRNRLAVLDRHLRALASHRSGRLAAGDSTALCWFAPSPRRATPASACGVDDTPPGLPDLGWRPHLTGRCAPWATTPTTTRCCAHPRSPRSPQRSIGTCTPCCPTNTDDDIP
jgi:hypothetical protein